MLIEISYKISVQASGGPGSKCCVEGLGLYLMPDACFYRLPLAALWRMNSRYTRSPREHVRDL